jgi:hypothetical protein
LDGKDGLTHIAVFISFFAIFACFLPVFGFFYLFFFSMNHVISAKNLPPHHPTQAPLTNGAIVEISIFFYVTHLSSDSAKARGSVNGSQTNGGQWRNQNTGVVLSLRQKTKRRFRKSEPANRESGLAGGFWANCP